LGNEATVSQRVVPGVLVGKGFRFAQPTVEEALTWALGLKGSFET
jgi:NAD dependent epimerase/dehydratase family enzyme